MSRYDAIWGYHLTRLCSEFEVHDVFWMRIFASFINVMHYCAMNEKKAWLFIIIVICMQCMIHKMAASCDARDSEAIWTFYGVLFRINITHSMIKGGRPHTCVCKFLLNYTLIFLVFWNAEKVQTSSLSASWMRNASIGSVSNSID